MGEKTLSSNIGKKPEEIKQTSLLPVSGKEQQQLVATERMERNVAKEGLFFPHAHWFKGDTKKLF